MIALALALESARGPIIDWQPFGMQRTPNGGLFDRTSAKRTGDVVDAWVRLVNVQFKDVNEAREQTDLHMEVDCRRPMMRFLAYRVVRPDGTILKSVEIAPQNAKWQAAGPGTRSADARSALCIRVR